VPFFKEEFFGVTGDYFEIIKLTGALNVAFNRVPGSDEETYLVDHSSHTVLINPYGHYHGYFKSPLNASRLKLTMS